MDMEEKQSLSGTFQANSALAVVQGNPPSVHHIIPNTSSSDYSTGGKKADITALTRMLPVMLS